MKFITGLLLVSAMMTSSTKAQEPALIARMSDDGSKVEVFRRGSHDPVVTQVAREDFRPFVHPIESPDGQGTLTEYSPGHHKHQTGLYWGFTRVNGRDYFHHPEGTHWKRRDVQVVTAEAMTDTDVVQWQTTYELLGEDGRPVLIENQLWTMSANDSTYTLELAWSGTAETDVTIGRYDYGGLFLRMPWQPGVDGEAINGARQRGMRAEGQRSVWMDVGIKVPGRENRAHIAIFDHPENKGFPQPWRVDGQLGVGPVRARMGDWKIRKGETEKIRHQVVVYTGELDDVALTERWSEFSGQRMAWAQWSQAQREGREAEFLTPERAVGEMTLKDGFAANVWASEPMISQPMAFCWDSKGRLWVCENRDYETRQTGFANDGNSRIVILEDTDSDGKADSKKVFAEGIPFPAGIAVGMGGVWLGAPPNLLFIPDKDQDDKADMDDIEIRLTGWGIRDRHETLNSFHWGPDGWLYGCQGFATPSKVGKPKGKGRLYRHREEFPSFEEMPIEGNAVDINGGVWRYHPTRQRFEVVAHGFSNPWGIDYDSKGQLFITACVIPHLWHVVPGGIYHRQGGSHFNPHVYADIRTIADHRHRSAHGGCRVYLSDAFPERYKGRIFMANIHEHAVLTDIPERKGSGYVGKHGDDFALANNAQWIGFSTEIGPDGSVYILDWHDADICGKEVLNKDTGRIFRYSAVESRAEDFPNRYSDLTMLSDLELVKLQMVESAWHARRARIILQHRATERRLDQEAVDALWKQFKGLEWDTAVDGDRRGDGSAIQNRPPGEDVRLRAYWALHVTSNVTREQMTAHLSDSDEYIRAWSIQFLCEDGMAAEDIRPKLVDMAVADPSPVVRLYLAAAIQRIEPSVGWPIAEALTQHAEDANDHNIPKMIWFGLERFLLQDISRAVQLGRSSKQPLIARHIARRLGSDNQFEALVSAIAKTDDPQQLLLGMRDSLEGRYDVKAPSTWKSAYSQLRKQGGQNARLALQLSQQFGDDTAAATMLATLQDSSASVHDRRVALTGLVGRKRPEVKDALASLLDDKELRLDAIRAAAAFADENLATTLLERYDSFQEKEKLEAIHTLASRSESGRKLTEAIRDNKVPRSDVPAYVARILQRVVGNGFLEVWGPVEGMSADHQEALDRYRQLITSAAGGETNPSRGRLLFNKTCAACHKLYGHGGNVGPDITGANRSNLDYLIGNIVTPSAIIQDAYRMQIVLTVDGRVYSGIPSGEDERVLRLRVANQDQPVVIPKSSIEERETAKVSMMPEGLLKEMTDQDIVDLFAYLQTQKQVDLPRTQAP